MRDKHVITSAVAIISYRSFQPFLGKCPKSKMKVKTLTILSVRRLLIQFFLNLQFILKKNSRFQYYKYKKEFLLKQLWITASPGWLLNHSFLITFLKKIADNRQRYEATSDNHSLILNAANISTWKYSFITLFLLQEGNIYYQIPFVLSYLPQPANLWSWL